MAKTSESTPAAPSGDPPPPNTSDGVVAQRRHPLPVFGAVAVLAVVTLALFGAWHVYNLAGLFLRRAQYVTDCLPSTQPALTTADCSRLAANPPPWPDGIEIRDRTLLLSYGQQLHSTATAIFTIVALLLAGVSTATALLAYRRASQHA